VLFLLAVCFWFFRHAAVLLSDGYHMSEPFKRRAAIAVTQAQPSTTAAVKARMTNVVIDPALLDPTAMPTKAAKKSTPVAALF